MKKQVKLYLVDDHKLLRDTLRLYLESNGNIQVVGESGSGAEAVVEIIRLQPDLVLMDITLPDYDGVEATRRIIEALPATRIIAVTMHSEQLYLVKFLEAGGSGYIHKSAADRDLLVAIEQVMRGDIFLSKEGIRVMAGKYRSNRSKADQEYEKDISPQILSSRERQVIVMLSRGYTCREIGEKLFLSTSTIETYKRRVNDKLQLNSKAELVEYAIKHKLFEEI
ncbi:MAG: response regulator transcription factor [Syntrophomonadaceae bacterium]|nr:response regulator transcription factor [Syntrophomonadaceae bacterium]